MSIQRHIAKRRMRRRDMRMVGAPGAAGAKDACCGGCAKTGGSCGGAPTPLRTRKKGGASRGGCGGR